MPKPSHCKDTAFMVTKEREREREIERERQRQRERERERESAPVCRRTWWV